MLNFLRNKASWISNEHCGAFLQKTKKTKVDKFCLFVENGRVTLFNFIISTWHKTKLKAVRTKVNDLRESLLLYEIASRAQTLRTSHVSSWTTNGSPIEGNLDLKVSIVRTKIPISNHKVVRQQTNKHDKQSSILPRRLTSIRSCDMKCIQSVAPELFCDYGRWLRD